VTCLLRWRRCAGATGNEATTHGDVICPPSVPPLLLDSIGSIDVALRRYYASARICLHRLFDFATIIEAAVENRFITVSGEVTATSKSESAAAPPPMHVHLEFLVGADKAVDDFSMTLKPDNEISPTKWTYSMRYGWIPEKWDKLSLVMTDDSHFAPTPSSGANTMSGNRFTRTPGTPKQQRQTGTPKRSSGGSRSHK
jgi:hypothetical protein